MSKATRGVPDAISHTDTRESLEYITGWNDCRAAMLAAQQEPVAWLVVSKYSGGKRLDVEWNIDADAMAFALGRLPLYTTPQAQRKPLDAGEISRLWKQYTNEDGPHHNPYDDDGLGFARAIEAAHNIKENT